MFRQDISVLDSKPSNAIPRSHNQTSSYTKSSPTILLHIDRLACLFAASPAGTLSPQKIPINTHAASAMATDSERQLAEIEAIRAIFGEESVREERSSSPERSVTIALGHLHHPHPGDHRENGFEVNFKLPAEYPSSQPAAVSVSCRCLDMKDCAVLCAKAREAAVVGEESMWIIAQAALEVFEELRENAKEKEQLAEMARANSQQVVQKVAEISALGRRLMYSHHIISKQKRGFIREWAKELDLSAIWKIGWPGIIICEGPEESCQEFVSRLQALRWKHFVVRGEETVSLENGMDLDEKRALPRMVEEFGENEMSVVADICKEAGLGDLFMTSMKVYK